VRGAEGSLLDQGVPGGNWSACEIGGTYTSPALAAGTTTMRTAASIYAANSLLLLEQLILTLTSCTPSSFTHTGTTPSRHAHGLLAPCSPNPLSPQPPMA
jgi:hypothetical protein